MGNIEVEVKLSIKNYDEVCQKLVQEGFGIYKELKEVDTYFTSDFYDMKSRGEALRIRRQIHLETGKIIGEITYKGKKLDTISMARKELETKIEDPDILEEIIKILGFIPVSPVEKIRKYYKKDKITACVDKVKNLGDFLELEIIVENENQREDALNKIELLLEKLGYNMKSTTTESYLSQLMRMGI